MRLAVRLALRDLRGGLGSLRLLALCLLLGVGSLAGVGSLSASILGAISTGGQAIVGGDVEMRVAQRSADPDERAAFAAAGTVSETARLRAMATRDGADGVLSELKGVDAAYPLYGRLRLARGALKPRPGVGEVAVAPALAERLRLKVGDTARFGDTPLRVIGLIAEEPDRLGEGFTLGPVAITDLGTLGKTGLMQPGSLYASRYRIRLAEPGADAKAVGEAMVRRFPSGGWEMRERGNAAPAIGRFVDRLGQFLSMIGLAALAVAGIGVGNGVAAYLDGKRRGFAILKVLGADGGTIFVSSLIQIAAVAMAGIAAGLVLGAVVPAVVAGFARDAMPVPPGITIHPLPLVVAAAYGLLVAMLFTLEPLARARAVSAAALFRSGVEQAGVPSWRVRIAQGLIAAGIAGLAIGQADQPLVAAGFILGVVLLLGVLGLVGIGVRRAAAALPRSRRPLLRLAIANLHRPGAPTARLVVALGLGLTLFVTLAAVQTSLGHAIAATAPARAPSFFVLDVPKEDIARFRRVVAARSPGAEIATVPMLRGSVVAVAGRRVADMKTIPAGAWVLRGDRGLTFASTLPPGSRLVAGKWWPVDYAGPPLVSIDAAAARALGLKVGDRLDVSVLGVDIAARIASLREIQWDTMGFNFAIVFAPGALEVAPYAYAATIAVPPAAELAVSRAVTTRFPTASIVRVKDVIGQVGELLGRIGLAVAAAGSVAVLAGIAVLIGAVAASRRARVHDAVLLKLVGATRGQVLAAQAIEFAAVAGVVALIALGVGLAAGWYVVTVVFSLDWAPDWVIVGGTLAAGVAGTVLLGLAVTLPALAARPAEALRSM